MFIRGDFNLSHISDFTNGIVNLPQKQLVISTYHTARASLKILSCNADFTPSLGTKSTLMCNFLLRNLSASIRSHRLYCFLKVTSKSTSLLSVCSPRTYDPKTSKVSTLYFSLRTGMSSRNCLLISSNSINECNSRSIIFQEQLKRLHYVPQSRLQ